MTTLWNTGVHPSTRTQGHAFVWRSIGSGPKYFVQHSDSPTLTCWRPEFSSNERDAEPTGLQQLIVELFSIRADGPSRWQQLHRI